MSDPTSGSAPSPTPVDLGVLLQAINSQVQASTQRDAQLQTMLQTMTLNLTGSTGQASSASPAQVKTVAAERPILLSSATLADFTS